MDRFIVTNVGGTYLVECYWPGVTETAVTEACGRADRAARQLSAEGHGVRFLGSLLVPTDEVAWCLFAGESREGVERASRLAELPFDRVMECVTSDPRAFPNDTDDERANR